MRVPIEKFKDTGSGPIVILGNGPSLDWYTGKKFKCPAIGINISFEYFPDVDYYLTIAFDRLADVADGIVTAKKAVFTCEQRAHVIPDDIPQPVTYADMSLDDTYSQEAGKKCIFHHDLTKPIPAAFGGIYALQACFFMGYNPIYLVGFEGGGKTHCSKHPLLGKGRGSLEHHIRVHWHVAYWLEHQDKFQVYQTNPDAGLKWYPIAKDFGDLVC